MASYRTHINWVVTAALALCFFLARGSDWQSTQATHTLMETVATLLAFTVGAMSLVRYYTQKDALFLLLGTGFLATSLLDAYHAVVTSAYFQPYMPSGLIALIPWSWVASRLLFSIFMVLSWLAYRYRTRMELTTVASERSAFLFSAAFGGVCFAFFTLAPLPSAYYPDLFFHRPQELIPAALFALALWGFLNEGDWRHDAFHHWLVLSLIVGVTAQLAFMPFSNALFDVEFDAAHLLKKVSYICVQVGLLVSMYDIFSRENANREELRDLYDNAPDMFVSVDAATSQIINCNDTLANNLGYPKNELIGQPIFFVYHRDCMVEARATFEAFVARGEVRNKELSLKRRNGEKVPVALNVSANRDAHGNVVSGRLVWRDISALKATEGRLRLMASVFTSSQEGVLITTAAGEIVEVNEAFTEITGYQREDCIGNNPRILKSGLHDDAFYDAMWASLTETGTWRGDVWNRRKNGAVFPEMLTISAVEDDRGNVEHYVGLFSDITHIKENEQQLLQMAQYDPLTNLPNRVLLSDRLRQAMANSDRGGSELMLAYIDLDGFKQVNDTFGHQAGDVLLVEVSRRMSAEMRDIDTLARIGGDEFVVVVGDVDSPAAADTILSRLLAAASAEIQIGEHKVSVSASAGATFYPQTQAVDGDQLQRQADQSMYEAKLAGRNTWRFFDTERETLQTSRYRLIGELEAAVAGNELELLYQPKVNMRTGEVIGAEALLRWHHPQRGILRPSQFLPEIENHPVAVSLGEWVTDSALEQLCRWRKLDIDIPISVNVAAEQIQATGFVDDLLHRLNSHGELSPSLLELELLESSAVSDFDQVRDVIQHAESEGLNFALDDFGSGYSSLLYLKNLPVKTLKIDQAFVRSLLNHPEDEVILSGILKLADNFELTALAEGVETKAHRDVLLKLGCELGQGFAIAHPLTADEFEGWLEGWQSGTQWEA